MKRETLCCNHYNESQLLQLHHKGSISVRFFKPSAVYESNIQKKLTADHLWRVTVFRPSTNRRREASVNVISGVKTAHKRWVHPWPSVGLQARKKVSGDGHGVIVLSSFPALGQSRQSWFYSQVLGKIKSKIERATDNRRFQGLLVIT